MKYTLSTVAALVAATAVSFGYTTSTTNLIGGAPSETPIVDNTGSPIAIGAGVVAVGYFTTTDGDIGTAADVAAVLAGFQQFGLSSAAGFQNVFSAPGFFSHETDASIPNGGNAFTGQNVYTLVGNGSTLAGSDQVAVWKGTAQFTEENQLGLGSVNSNVTPGAGAFVFGDAGGPVDLGFAQFTDSLALSSGFIIPEPSSALLLGLGGLGLLIRRKR